MIIVPKYGYIALNEQSYMTQLRSEVMLLELSASPRGHFGADFRP